MNKLLFYSILAIIILSGSLAKAQQKWNFDGINPLASSDFSAVMKLYTVKEVPEFVKGLKGKGFRTDGYSTWMNTLLNPSTKVVGLSGWFALESFPTDTAAFIGLKVVQSQKSIAICVNRFGELMVGVGDRQKIIYHSMNRHVDRFSWLHLAVSFQKNRASFFLDGRKLKTIPLKETPFQGVTELRVAKDYRDKKQWMYDITTINGLVDEIEVWDKPFNLKKIKTEILAFAKKTPILAIPESRFVNDFNRPLYHLFPAANWTNETHGLIFYKGKYHIFNQKSASGIFLGQINWGHFSSPDLIHWTEHKPALTPDKDYDKNGIWSGCTVINDEGVPQIIYTAGGDEMGVGIAFPKDDELIEWEKYKNNPVISRQPKGYIRSDLHDQYVWKEGDKWYMIIGYGIQNGINDHGTVLLYKSTDLKKWDFIHLFFEGNPEIDKSGIFWEMPVFKKIGDKYILLVNRVPYKGVPARSQYWIGDFKNEKFIPDNPIPQNLEVINRLLSPSLIETTSGELVSIAIIPDEIGGEATYKQGWAHMYSIPRVWNLSNGKITQAPYPALQQLRSTHTDFTKQKIEKNHPFVINKTGHQIEVKATFYPGDARKYGFVLYKNKDNSEYSSIYYDVENHELVVDQTTCSLRKDIPLQVRKDNYNIDSNKPVEFHLFIDGSVMEGFINNEDAFTTRIFPLKEDSSIIELFSDGEETEIEADVWNLNTAKVKMNY